MISSKAFLQQQEQEYMERVKAQGIPQGQIDICVKYAKTPQGDCPVEFQCLICFLLCDKPQVCN
jgi:hypothetical protein